MADKLYQEALKNKDDGLFPLYILNLAKALDKGLHPDDIELNIRPDHHFVNRHYYTIIEILTVDIETNDKNGYLYIMLGEVYSILYLYGTYRRLESQIENAIKYYDIAINKGNAYALYRKGSFLLDIDRTEEGLQCYHDAFEKGYIEAMYSLGMRYERLYYYNVKTVEYFEMAADKGYRKAMIRLYFTFTNNEHFYNHEKAIKYLKMYIHLNPTYITSNHKNVVSKKELTKDLFQILYDTIAENKGLKEENKNLKLEVLDLKYKPGGEGAKEAKEHFESLLLE